MGAVESTEVYPASHLARSTGVPQFQWNPHGGGSIPQLPTPGPNSSLSFPSAAIGTSTQSPGYSPFTPKPFASTFQTDGKEDAEVPQFLYRKRILTAANPEPLSTSYETGEPRVKALRSSHDNHGPYEDQSSSSEYESEEDESSTTHSVPYDEKREDESIVYSCADFLDQILQMHRGSNPARRDGPMYLDPSVPYPPPILTVQECRSAPGLFNMPREAPITVLPDNAEATPATSSPKGKRTSGTFSAMNHDIHQMDEQGYTWNKYGMKTVKRSSRTGDMSSSGRSTRWYYRCKTPSCKARKTVECVLNEDGSPSTDQGNPLVVYHEEHNHEAQVVVLTDRVSSKESLHDCIQRYQNQNHTKDSMLIVNCDGFIEPPSDQYSWRKYGEKLIKSSDSNKSYFKCSTKPCPCKRTMERSENGFKLVYKGKHIHP